MRQLNQQGLSLLKKTVKKLLGEEPSRMIHEGASVAVLHCIHRRICRGMHMGATSNIHATQWQQGL